MNYDEFFKASACDNAPRLEVVHETQLANSSLDGSDVVRAEPSLDEADVGGNQADPVQPVGRCVMCGDPVEDGRDIHIECIPF